MDDLYLVFDPKNGDFQRVKSYVSAKEIATVWADETGRQIFVLTPIAAVGAKP